MTTLIVINAPAIFSGLWNVMVLLDAEVVAKVSIFGSDKQKQRDELERHGITLDGPLATTPVSWLRTIEGLETPCPPPFVPVEDRRLAALAALSSAAAAAADAPPDGFDVPSTPLQTGAITPPTSTAPSSPGGPVCVTARAAAGTHGGAGPLEAAAADDSDGGANSPARCTTSRPSCSTRRRCSAPPPPARRRRRSRCPTRRRALVGPRFTRRRSRRSSHGGCAPTAATARPSPSTRARRAVRDRSLRGEAARDAAAVGLGGGRPALPPPLLDQATAVRGAAAGRFKRPPGKMYIGGEIDTPAMNFGMVTSFASCCSTSCRRRCASCTTRLAPRGR